MPHHRDTIRMPDAFDLFTQATELIELGRLPEALGILKTMVKTDANNATVWNAIGIIRFRQGANYDAVQSFGQATAIDPWFASAWFNRSLALLNLGKTKEALQALEKVLKIHPHDSEAQSQYALIIRSMAQGGDKQKADAGSVQSRLRL